MVAVQSAGVPLPATWLKLLESAGKIKEGALIFEFTKNPLVGNIIAVVTFVALGYSLYHYARKPLENK